MLAIVNASCGMLYSFVFGYILKVFGSQMYDAYLKMAKKLIMDYFDELQIFPHQAKC